MRPPKKFREAFIKWCAEESKPPEEALVFEQWRNATESRKQLGSVEIGNKFVEYIKRQISEHKLISVNVSSQWETSQKLVGRGGDNIETELTNLSFTMASHKIVLEDLNIQFLGIHGNTGLPILLENCRISRLVIGVDHRPQETRLILRNSWVGNLLLFPKSNQHFEMTGGGIFNIDCPPPDGENPFTGSVIFGRDVFLPRSTKRYPIEGPQPYRNLQAHLLKLENGPAVSFIRAAEQAIERETDTRFNKFLSYLYQWFSNYGSSTLRPVIWLAFLLAFNIWLIYQTDGATRAFPDEFYVGWRENLLDTGNSGSISRAALLALQSILNPFGIFGARAMVVAETGLLNIWLGISGLFSAVLIALLILALRRRFKMR